MNIARRIHRVLSEWRKGRRFDADLDDEMRSHIELRASHLVQQGMSEREAARRAHVEFGSVGRYGDEVRAARRISRLLGPFRHISSDVLFGVRRLSATPLFTVFAVASLSIGAGATTSVYSVVDEILWRPSGIVEPERVAVLAMPRGDWFVWSDLVSFADADDFERRQTSLSSVALSARLVHPITTSTVADTRRVEAVSGSYFKTVGVGPAVGRVLDALDDGDNGSHVAVLGYRFWHAKFAGDAAIVGQSISVGGRAVQVVGVAQADFAGLGDSMEEDTAVFVPLRVARDLRLLPAADPSNRGIRPFALIGRLKAQRTVKQVSTEASAIAAELDRSAPLPNLPAALGAQKAPPRTWGAIPSSAIRSRLDAAPIPVGKIFVGMVGLVLLIACTNLANLMLGRGAVRQHELVVRRALGASRWRLIREQLVEGAIVLIASAIGTYVLARAILAALVTEIPLAPALVLRPDPSLDGGVLAFAAGMLVLTFLVFALVPAVLLTRAPEAPRLAGGAAQSGFRWRVRGRLIAWQVSISVALFLIAIVSFRFVLDRAFHDPGLDLDHLAIGVATTRGMTPASARQMSERFVQATSIGPESALSAVLTGLPFSLAGTPFATLSTVDRPFEESPAANYAGGPLVTGTAAMFEVLGVRVLSGRPFATSEVAEGRHIVVLSAVAAQQVFGSTDVLGRELLVKRRSFRLGAPPSVWRATVVGIAEDTDSQRFRNRSTGVIYAPLMTDELPFLVLAVRSDGDPAAAARALPAIMRTVDPEVALSTAAPARMVVTPEVVLYRYVTTICGVLAGLGLLMSMTGLYGVLSLLVSRRTREFGLRMALGGTSGRITWMVLQDGARPVRDGLIIGLLFGIGGRALFRYSTGQSSVSLFDPTGFAIVAVVLSMAAALACYVPARRASRINPIVALKEL